MASTDGDKPTVYQLDLGLLMVWANKDPLWSPKEYLWGVFGLCMLYMVYRVSIGVVLGVSIGASIWSSFRWCG